MSEAIVIVHWPGKDVPACLDHAIKLAHLGVAMGCPVSSTPIKAPTILSCTNCENEAKKEHEAEIRDRVLEEAVQAAKHTPFRVHAADDRDFHSGCEQTRDRIVDAIRALKSQVSAAGAASRE